MTNSAELVDDAANRVHLLSAEHFRDSAAARLLSSLSAKGVLSSRRLAAVPISDVDHLHTIFPGESHEFCQPVASMLHARWSRLSPAIISVYWAARRTVNMFGGEMSGELPPVDTVTHSLGLTMTALSLFRANPALRDAWIPEERFRNVHGQAKPDGAIADGRGIRLLIEFCGRYTASRLDRLATLADDSKLPIALFTVRSSQKTEGGRDANPS